MNERIAFLSVGGALAFYLVYSNSQVEKKEIKEKKDDIPLIINTNIRNIIPESNKQEIQPQPAINIQNTIPKNDKQETNIHLKQPIINNKIYYLLNRHPVERATLIDLVLSDIKKGIFKIIGGIALISVFFAGFYYTVFIPMYFIDLIKLRLAGITEITKHTLSRLKNKYKEYKKKSDVISDEDLKKVEKKFDEKLKNFMYIDDEIILNSKQDVEDVLIEKNSNSESTLNVIRLKSPEELIEQALKEQEEIEKILEDNNKIKGIDGIEEIEEIKEKKN